MSVTQPITQSLSALEREIAAAADEATKASAPLRVQPNAPAPREMWGPSNPRITSPQQMLAQVADHAQKLHQQMLELVAAITGEAPPPLRLRQAPRPGGGLLPMVGLMAHEIETVHVEIARLIEHLRGRL